MVALFNNDSNACQFHVTQLTFILKCPMPTFTFCFSIYCNPKIYIENHLSLSELGVWVYTTVHCAPYTCVWPFLS